MDGTGSHRTRILVNTGVAALAATTINRAVKAVSFHDDGDSRHKRITRTTAIYFQFQGHLLAADLMYNANDPKGTEYEDTLLSVVQSFRPLDGVDRHK